MHTRLSRHYLVAVVAVIISTACGTPALADQNNIDIGLGCGIDGDDLQYELDIAAGLLEPVLVLIETLQPDIDAALAEQEALLGSVGCPDVVCLYDVGTRAERLAYIAIQEELLLYATQLASALTSPPLVSQLEHIVSLEDCSSPDHQRSPLNRDRIRCAHDTTRRRVQVEQDTIEATPKECRELLDDEAHFRKTANNAMSVLFTRTMDQITESINDFLGATKQQAFFQAQLVLYSHFEADTLTQTALSHLELADQKKAEYDEKNCDEILGKG